MSEIQRKTMCIYHGNCADGFGAAWVVRKALGDDVEFVPGVYGQEPPDVTGKDVILVDFSYKYDVLAALSWKAHSVIVLDHHKSAAADLARFESFHAGIEEDTRHDDGSVLLGWKTAHDMANSQNGPSIACCFDMNRSGAMLAWDHFFPDQEPPQLLRHIEDRDLWLFQLDGTREIQANLFSYPYDFEIWDRLMMADVESLRSDGAAIERKHHKDIGELVAVTKRRMIIGGHDVPAANLPYTLTSDAGHLMCANEPFAACYWDTPDGRSFSLRSTDQGLDVSEIALQYGGGGHRNASGFRVPFGHELTL
ncbi:phosphohydrolase [Pseudomonas sp. HY13-MNA-CIBAN-0226]|uniref:phosphohydrolase n=1 Tax=Pseudomonas sp. HY13-MNA-CIBAN-0226 TaxID=3140473 RepID=UPI003323F321